MSLVLHYLVHGRCRVSHDSEARALFGFTKSEPIDSDRFLLALRSDDSEPVTQTLAKSMKGDGEHESERLLALPDGQVRWIAC